MKTIYFIYAEGCDSCKLMRKHIMDCKKKKDFELKEFECETDEAFNFAVNNEIDDLPACRIGDITIQGEKFNETELVECITEFCR